MVDERFDELLDFHNSRSKISRETDEAKKATMTTDPDEWLANPDEFDYAGIDTPKAETQRDVMEFNRGDLSLRELGDRL